MSAAQEFKFNGDDAQAADEGQRILESGAFTGKFTKFKWIVAQSGAAGYSFDFESDSGQVAERLSIYTIGRDGQDLNMGRKKMSALLCCLGIASIAPKPMNIKESVYDEAEKKYKDDFVSVDMYVDAMNKPIGIILQAEDYTGNDGQERRRVNYLQAFQASTGRNAREMFEASKATKAGDAAKAPEHVDNVLATLRDKDSRSSGSAPQQQQTNNEQAIHDDFDDDIPF